MLSRPGRSLAEGKLLVILCCEILIVAGVGRTPERLTNNGQAI